MWIELGSLVISSLLSLAGVGLPQLSIDPANAPAITCLTQAPDSCLQSDVCDVFIGSGGQEVCGVACDMRGLDTCSLDSNCTVVDGACDYADTSPVGC